MTDLSRLPSVEQLLQTQQVTGLVTHYGRPLTLHAIRTVLQQVRADVSFYPEGDLPENNSLLERAAEQLNLWIQPTLLPVINASGVILHTNLGRAPLSVSALAAIQAVAQG